MFKIPVQKFVVNFEKCLGVMHYISCMKNVKKEKKARKMRQKTCSLGLLPNAGLGFYSHKKHVFIVICIFKRIFAPNIEIKLLQLRANSNFF